jgi:hypothetical protein
MSSGYLTDVFGWGSLTSPLLDDYTCWFFGLLTVLALLITRWLHI